MAEALEQSLISTPADKPSDDGSNYVGKPEGEADGNDHPDKDRSHFLAHILFMSRVSRGRTRLMGMDRGDSEF